MSMDKSLKTSGRLHRQRSVLTRAERIARLKQEERWRDGDSPLGLPKVKVVRAVIKKGRRAKQEAEAKAAKEAEEGKGAPGKQAK